jgi:hypothetical protein
VRQGPLGAFTPTGWGITETYKFPALAVARLAARQEYKDLVREAAERGMLLIQVEREHLEAEHDRRIADAARVRTLIEAGQTGWARGQAGWEAPAGEMAPATPPPAPRDPAMLKVSATRKSNQLPAKSGKRK